ncbi:MAG: DUF2461 domain-containing protein [bacterium]|nr:DUF2461 domain-containing protein [bacterium]
MPQRHFTPALFRYLRDLAAHNDREWFQANKDRYINELRDPCLEFITDFGARLARISPHFRSDPRPSGGSLFRIYRDVRFSHDKSPYKTHAGLHFRHVAGKNAYTPGFYLHLEPGACMVGLGLWHPDNKTLKPIRDLMVADPECWRRAVGSKAFGQRFQVAGESLKRVPRGYDPDHPLAEVLKLKDITAFTTLTQKNVTTAGFVDAFARDCRDGAPLVKFICEALDQPF